MLTDESENFLRFVDHFFSFSEFMTRLKCFFRIFTLKTKQKLDEPGAILNIYRNKKQIHYK